MKNNKKGFTLMEMLIVVAIIAVLVAIAIPVLNTTLEKSREAVDAANLRSAYAECTVKVLEEGKEQTATVKATQTEADWQNASITEIAGVPVAEKGAADTTDKVPALTSGSSWLVTVATDGTVTFTEKTGA